MKKIIVTGNVGRDPEARADQTGNQFITFSLGVSVGTKQNPKTDWVEISCSGRLLDVAKNYVKKGSKLLVEGFPSVSAYVNRENKPVGTLRIYASNFEFLSRKDDGEEDHASADGVYKLPESGADSSSHNNFDTSLQSDEIPF